MKKLSILLGIILIFAGCSNNATERIAVCEKNNDSVQIKEEIKALGNRLVSQNQESIIDLREVGLNEETAQKLVEDYQKKYSELKGVTYKSEIKDNKMIERISINLEEANISELNELDLSQSDEKDADEWDFDKSVKHFESTGMKCEIK